MIKYVTSFILLTLIIANFALKSSLAMAGDSQDPQSLCCEVENDGSRSCEAKDSQTKKKASADYEGEYHFVHVANNNPLKLKNNFASGTLPEYEDAYIQKFLIPPSRA